MNTLKQKLGFSLVELIVVITILAILVTLATISSFSYIKNGNDAKRVTDIQWIRVYLDSYRRNHSLLYPTHEWWSGATQIVDNTILAPGNPILATQWYFTEYLAGKIWMVKVPVDPKTKLPYLYSISRDRISYQLTTTLQKRENLVAQLPLKQAYANPDYNLVAYVEGNFIPRNPLWFPGLLYAVNPLETTTLDISSNDVNGSPNIAKVILNGQSLNLWYDMDGKPISYATDLPSLLSGVSLVSKDGGTGNYGSCEWVLNPSFTYYHGENDVEYMPWTTLWSQIWWKYKTCDGSSGNGVMKPESDFYYNCANIWAGAVFSNTCVWTGCSSGYSPRTDGTPWCKMNMNAPLLATPNNGWYNLPLAGTLSWYAVSGNNIRYNIYLGTNTPNLVSENQSTTSFWYSGLNYGTTYNWYVEACDGINCISSITYTFSTLPNPDWWWWTGWGETWGGTTTPSPDPDVNNCESWIVVCSANDVVITYVAPNGTPLDGKLNDFGTSQRITDKYYGWEKILQYKITNNSDGRAKFKLKLWLTSSGVEFTNAANASFDNSNIGSVLDIWEEGIANNFFWKPWNGCIYNSSTRWYEVMWQTTCFFTLHARADSSVTTTSQIVSYFQVVNTDPLATWTTNFTTPTALSLKSSGFSSTPLTFTQMWNAKQILEPSTDATTNDFGTSTRIGWLWGEAHWYWKSLTYNIVNSHSQDAFFRLGMNGQNTSYIDAFGNIKWYDFPTTVLTPLTWDPNNISTWQDNIWLPWQNFVIDIWSNGVENVFWKNNNCLSSPSGTWIGKWFMIPKNSNCSITFYFRGDVDIPFYNRNVISAVLLNQTIANRNYTYDLTLKTRAEGWMVPFEHYVMSETLGWIKLHIEVYDSGVTGMASSEIAGWICFESSCGATVTRSMTSWQLSWYALSEMFGWIDMSWVTFNNNGTSTWYAQSEIIGWINFNGADLAQ